MIWGTVYRSNEHRDQVESLERALDDGEWRKASSMLEGGDLIPATVVGAEAGIKLAQYLVPRGLRFEKAGDFWRVLAPRGRRVAGNHQAVRS